MNPNLLVAVDESPAARRALEMLAGHRSPAGTRVVALNVQARPIALWPEGGLDPGRIDAVLLEEGRRIAAAASAALAEKGFAAEPAARLGIPAGTILQEVDSRRADMLLMGTRGRGAVQGYALGSVALRVAHRSSVPMWLVRPDSRLPDELGRRLRVMLATDGSEVALRAARFLVAWRAWLGELDVHIAHVQLPLTWLEAVLPPHDDLIEQWSTRAAGAATQAAGELLASESIRSHLHFSAGEPAAELAHLAHDAGCDALVLGTRGLGAAHHALIGSVALKAAALAAMPVILVP